MSAERRTAPRAIGGLLAVLLVGGAVYWWYHVETERDQRSAMFAVLYFDELSGEILQRAVADGRDPAESIHRYVGSCRIGSFNRCPADFREAYVRHVNAWETLEGCVRREPRTFVDGFVNGLARRLRGENG